MLARRNRSASSGGDEAVGESGGFMGGLMDNELFSAGFGLFGVGMAAGLLRTGWRQGAVVLQRQCFVTLEIPSKDKSYHWVLQWISAKASTRTRHLSVGEFPSFALKSRSSLMILRDIVSAVRERKDRESL